MHTAFVSIKLVGFTNLENILKASDVFGRRSMLHANLPSSDALRSLNLVQNNMKCNSSSISLHSVKILNRLVL